MAERKLSVVITGDAKGARKAMGDVGSGADGMQSKLQSVGAGVGKTFKAAALGAGALAVGVGAFLKGGADSLIELERLAAQTGAVIKSTGGAAGVTADQVEKYAQSIEKATGIEAEGIISGQNMLLTFTNLKNGVGAGNDIFNQATDIMTDMSVAMGTDASKTAVQLGKALNDPIKGISALSKVGVTFTDQQKAQIKAMVEAGDVAGAQKIILAELNKEFGGSAEAFGDTTAGKVQKLKNLFGDMQEELAKRLLPVIEKVADWLADKIPAATKLIQDKIAELGPTFDKIAGYARQIGDAFVTFAEKARPVFEAIGRFIAANPAPIFGALAVVIGGALLAATVAWGASLFAALSPIYLVIAAVALVAGGLIYAYQHFEGFRNVVDSVASWITGTLWPALQTLGGWLLDALPVAVDAGRTALGWLVDKATELYVWFQGNVLPVLQAVGGWLADNLPPAVGAAVAAVDSLVGAARVLWAWIGINVMPVLQTLGDYLGGFFALAWGLASNAIQWVIDKARELWTEIDTKLMPELEDLGAELSQDLYNGATTAGTGFDVLRQKTATLATENANLMVGVGALASLLAGALVTGASTAWRWISDLASLIASEAVVQFGILAGLLKDAVVYAFDVASDAVGRAVDQVQTVVGWFETLIGVAGRVADAINRIPSIPGIGFGGGVGGIGAILGIPGFAAGGRPEVGVPAVVGERGPELFIPDTAGTIVPAAATRSVLGGSSGGGDTYVTIQMNGPVLDGRELGRLAAEGLNEYGVSQNQPIIATSLVG